ncbi:hydroxyproline-rich glycoprotein [Dorcoceras hygrometricum]|uniref:Hydroxyproline-rich glycoprotein n=1 Tax=Dorcoceras hygrometricum TaxID=472368 RepID=A0A2Z7BM82_9LAMI|nr:hydroxyproline-rich glycoprotein [Dorcoceras hygrometricum]
MSSRVVSLDSKVEEMLNIQTFMKHDFSTYKNGFYDKMDTVAAKVTSSQTSLETSLVRQLIEHQLQLANMEQLLEQRTVDALSVVEQLLVHRTKDLTAVANIQLLESSAVEVIQTLRKDVDESDVAKMNQLTKMNQMLILRKEANS